jgi:hypothetical protein
MIENLILPIEDKKEWYLIVGIRFYTAEIDDFVKER